jgi:triacylglycerol lipase
MAANDTIVLAHGLFGFGQLFPNPLSPFTTYFHGVADHLRARGFKVRELQVNPIGSVKQRGDLLALEIAVKTSANERVHILAHSMGGLDARHVVATRQDLVPRIKTIVTIGTPHNGSPVADAVNNPTDPLFQHIPEFLKFELHANAGALKDLTTDACKQFNQKTPDVRGIRYINVAGDASKSDHELVLFQLAAVIGGITGEINDGVVTKSSALRDGKEHLEDWAVDHEGEIGWRVKSVLGVPIVSPAPSADHLARYDAIVNLL